MESLAGKSLEHEGEAMKSFWTERKTFVTGATGFLGAHLVGQLLDQGAQVVCLERDTARPNTLDLLGLRPRVTLVSGSLEDGGLMERVLNEHEIEAVFHLAAQALVVAANRSPLSTFESNIRGTYALLEACRRTGGAGRIVVASSDKAYGVQPRLPYTEEHPLLGLNPYDASKVCADVLARCYARSYGLPVGVARMANLYGPGDVNLSRIVPGTIISVLRGQSPVIRSDGTPVRDYLYVEDAARAYLLLAESAGELRGEALNFGSGEPVKVLDLVEKIIRLAGKQGQVSPQVMSKTKIAGEIDAQYLSSKQSEAKLGWKPQVRLDEGLQRSVEWYRERLEAITAVENSAAASR
jgi:CDP-glucose 4,6-dehydratase